jgi:hypothetical protein
MLERSYETSSRLMRNKKKTYFFGYRAIVDDPERSRAGVRSLNVHTSRSLRVKLGLR